VTLVISPATPADVGSILSLIRELAEFEHLAHEVVATEDVLQASLFGPHPGAETLLARVDGEIAGFALFFHNFSTFVGLAGIHLEDLYVRPSYRGRGVGRALLGQVAGIARERGCGRMEWSVLNWNRRAIEFYESLGARPVAGWTVYRLDHAALAAMPLPVTG